MPQNYKLIALCTSRIYDSQVHSFIEAFNEYIKNRGMRMCIYSISTDLYWVEDEKSAEPYVFQYIPFEKIDLCVIMDEKIKSRRIAEDIIRRAREKQKPVIVLDGSYPDCISIRFDYKRGFRRVVEHVFSEHTVLHPHYMAGIKGNVFSEERMEMFKEVLEAHHMTFDETMVSYGEFWADPARKATKELLEREEIPDAIFCANDIMAINVCDVLKEAGLNVPRDVIVTGFDGYDEAYLATPGITTASCDLSEMAETTGIAVEQCLSGEFYEEEFMIIPRLVCNESCGCPRCELQSSSMLSRFNNGFYRYQDDIRMMHNTITDMMRSDSTNHAVTVLQSGYTSKSCCILNRGCLVSEQDFFSTEQEEEYVLLYDPSMPGIEPLPFQTQEIIPLLNERLDNGYPLLIQPVDYMNRPMGYICYFLDTYDITEYGKTANITEMVSMGVGGYSIMRHQRYLAKKVEEMYQLDALTGLYNRLAFQEAFDALVLAPENAGRKLLVVMADLDRLKKINDTLGHGAGDQAIAAVAHALKDACPAQAICVRFGGDEMLAFIPDEEEAGAIIKSIETTLEATSQELGFRVSASCGAYCTEISETINMEELVFRADERMYIVKKAGYDAG